MLCHSCDSVTADQAVLVMPGWRVSPLGQAEVQVMLICHHTAGAQQIEVTAMAAYMF